MFCPKCRYEYNPGIFVCPDCDEKLVAVLPEIPEKDPIDEASIREDWIELARLTSSTSAQMLIDVLHSKNIPSVALSGSGHFGQTGQMGSSSFPPAGGAFSIMVHKEYVVEADNEGRALLGEEWDKGRL